MRRLLSSLIGNSINPASAEQLPVVISLGALIGNYQMSNSDIKDILHLSSTNVFAKATRDKGKSEYLLGEPLWLPIKLATNVRSMLDLSKNKYSRIMIRSRRWLLQHPKQRNSIGVAFLARKG